MGGAAATLSPHKAVNNLLDGVFHVLIFCLKSHAEYFRDLKIPFAKSSDSLMSYSTGAPPLPLQKKKKKSPKHQRIKTKRIVFNPFAGRLQESLWYFLKTRQKMMSWVKEKERLLKMWGYGEEGPLAIDLAVCSLVSKQ